MSITVEKFTEIQNRVREAQKRKDRAAGVLSQIKKQLNTTHGCSTLAEAKALLKKKKVSLQKKEEELERAEEEFNQKYKDVLGNLV